MTLSGLNPPQINKLTDVTEPNKQKCKHIVFTLQWFQMNYIWLMNTAIYILRTCNIKVMQKTVVQQTFVHHCSWIKHNELKVYSLFLLVWLGNLNSLGLTWGNVLWLWPDLEVWVFWTGYCFSAVFRWLHSAPMFVMALEPGYDRGALSNEPKVILTLCVHTFFAFRCFGFCLFIPVMLVFLAGQGLKNVRLSAFQSEVKKWLFSPCFDRSAELNLLFRGHRGRYGGCVDYPYQNDPQCTARLMYTSVMEGLK